ncbi:MAG: Hsp33 family molecular chaperone HslO [Deltaproteobacteria bacterium]|nr:Hsp33 family molecular chaperone HslO [Deltaproteobacteria bacterium]
MDTLVKGLTDEGLLVFGLVDTATVEKARLIHGTYPTASAALGRVISGSLLLASTLKDNQKVELQVAGDGPLKEIFAEADPQGRVRGYVARPHVQLELKNNKLDVGGAVGKGFLNVLKSLGGREPYRGTVTLQTGEIAEDLAYYLSTSEQVPSAVALGVYVDTDNSVKAAGGYMVQPLPGTPDETIDYLENRLKTVRPVSSMILDGLGPKEIMNEAVGLPIKFIDEIKVNYFCPCSKSRVLDAVAALGKADIEDYIKKGESVEVTCRFCKSFYKINPEELEELLKNTQWQPK